MSVVIYDSSEEDLSSDEYSHDEDDDDLMNAAVTAGSSKTLPNKSNTCTLMASPKAALRRVAPPSGREQTTKQIHLLKKKQRIHLFYKTRSIKLLNDKNKRDQQRKALKQRIQLIQLSTDMEKLKSVEAQKVSTAKKELEQFLVHQREAGVAAVTTLKQQQPEKELTVKHKNEQSLQCTPPKPLDLVCLDDTENEESPEKPTLPVSPEPLASAPSQTDVVTQTRNTQVTIVDVRSSDFDVDKDVGVVQMEVKTTEIEICTSKVEPEKPEVTAAKEIHVKNKTCNELLTDAPVPPVIVPLSQNIEVPPTPMDLEFIPNNVPLKQPIRTPIKVNQIEPTKLPKNSVQLQTQAAAAIAAAQKKAANVVFAPPPPPPTAQVSNPVPTPIRVHFALSTSTPRPTAAVVNNIKSQNVQILPPTPEPQATNFSRKRQHSPTPSPGTPRTRPNDEKSSIEIINNDTQHQNPPKRPLLDPASNAAFYDKIKDLLPAYEEAISVQVKAAITTDDKLNEKIKRIHSDLNTLGGLLKTKETEWNRLLYLKHVKEELLERLLRVKQVHKATKRCQDVKNYTIKQLQELEACLSEECLTPIPENPPSNIETFGNRIMQLVHSRANMCAEELMKEGAVYRMPNDYVTKGAEARAAHYLNSVNSVSDHRKKSQCEQNESRQSAQRPTNRSATFAERDQQQQQYHSVFDKKKQLQELEAYLGEERPTPIRKKPTSNIETVGNHIKQLARSRADAMEKELAVKKMLDKYVFKPAEASAAQYLTNANSVSDHHKKSDRDPNESRQSSQRHANRSATLAEYDHQQQQQHRISDSYALRSENHVERQRNATMPLFNADYGTQNSSTVAQHSASQPPVSIGRQGAFKDVQSIVDDFRRENPHTLPRVGKRLKPEMYATQQNESGCYPQHVNFSAKDLPTLQKMLSDRARNNLQQHSYVAPMPMPPLYRPGYNASHNLSGTSTVYSEQPPRSYIPERNVRPNLNNFEYYGRRDITMNGVGSDVKMRNKLGLRICQECYKSVANFICEGCTNQWYCSKECQVTAWDKHQHRCGV